MKYKILLAGKNNTIINDFFSLIDGSAELMTTSVRWEDLLAHMRYFQPDAFCYCIYNEPVDIIKRMIVFKERLEENRIPFFLVGSDTECMEFTKIAVVTSDMTLSTPIKAATIEENIIKYLDKRREEEDRRREEERRRAAELERAAELARRKHVLVVDDDSMMLKTIKEQLHDKYDIATAISGKIALKFLEKKMTDLILLDYEMPGESGPDVLEKLRENDRTKEIPVIFLTGVTERDKIAQVLVMKPQGYLLKPIDHDKLTEAIDKVLGGKEDGE